MTNTTDETMDLLDLDDDTDISNISEINNPFVNNYPKSKKNWLLIVVGLVIIALAGFLIYHTITSDRTSSIDINLDEQIVESDVKEDNSSVKDSKDSEVQIDKVSSSDKLTNINKEVITKEENKKIENSNKEISNTEVNKEQKKEEIVVDTPKPVKEVVDRKPVVFNPSVKSRSVKVSEPVNRTVKKKVASRWYTQFGSYSSREKAISYQNRLTSKYKNLFTDKQFIVLSAVLPNGNTAYRLRIAFDSLSSANSFCSKSRSNGLECYVSK